MNEWAAAYRLRHGVQQRWQQGKPTRSKELKSHNGVRSRAVAYAASVISGLSGCIQNTRLWFSVHTASLSVAEAATMSADNFARAPCLRGWRLQLHAEEHIYPDHAAHGP